jgi:hypothetical protein
VTPKIPTFTGNRKFSTVFTKDRLSRRTRVTICNLLVPYAEKLLASAQAIELLTLVFFINLKIIYI